MARAAQSTFDQRLARIQLKAASGAKATSMPRVAPGAGAYQKEHLVQSRKKQRKLHWDMVAFGAVAGGLVGTLFALNVGLLLIASLNAVTLYQMLLADYTMAALIAGVAIAPVGFVMSQIFARSNPRGWQFWIGYLAAVLASNGTDMVSYYYIVTAAAGQ